MMVRVVINLIGNLVKGIEVLAVPRRVDVMIMVRVVVKLKTRAAVPPGSLRGSIEDILTRMLADSAPFAGMCRYWVREKWGMDL